MPKFNVIIDAPSDECWRGTIDKTDFKQVLKFFRILNDKELTEEEKTLLTIKCFFNGMPKNEDAWEEIKNFIACGEETDEEESTSKKIFDYNEDHGRMFAAFWQAYKIDLRNTDLHWWVFCELFRNLPDDTKLMQIIDIRGRKPDKHDSPEYKKQLQKMQRQFAISANDDDGDFLRGWK